MKTKHYGDKRDYREIEIFVDGKYVATTTWAKTCKEAKERYKAETGLYPERIKAHFKGGQ